MPIEIGGSGITLAFRVIPELPAIARASMTIHIVADEGDGSVLFGCQQRALGRSSRTYGISVPIVATGDEDGTVEIEFELRKLGASC
jgi:hypothetical protein